jgi:hypothetical protein
MRARSQVFARRSARVLGDVRKARLGKAREAAEAPVAVRELAQRGVEGGFVEVRPIRVDEHELGVRAFPEQEVAEPPFAAGPDQEIDGCVHVGIDGLRQAALELDL